MNFDKNGIDFNSYQEEAYKFKAYDNLLYPILGLAEEAGEVCGKFAKAIRKGVDVNEEDLKKELGDVLWMVAAICTEFDIDLEDVAALNIEKLRDRQKRNVIVGEGDNR